MEKGHYGYGKRKLKSAILKTAICFALVFGAVIAGVLIFGNRRNIFTVIGICMVLPAANFCVNLIVRIKGAPAKEKEYQAFAARSQGLVTAEDLIVTANQKNIPIQLAVFAENGIIVYSAMKNQNIKVIQQDLNSLCSQAGIHGRMQVFFEFDPFLKRVSNIRPASETVTERLEEDRRVLLLYSL